LALCHEDLRRLVSHFEHLLTYRWLPLYEISNLKG
jgi:hypothetical protein